MNRPRMVIRVMRWLAVALWRGTALAVRGLLYAAVVVGWCAYVWLSGRPWRHNYRGRRYVTRPVRATGQCALTAVVALLAWRPLATAVVLAVVGTALVATALTIRHRGVAPAPSEPIRVKATVGTPLPLTSGSVHAGGN